jgi:hypothetical protein
MSGLSKHVALLPVVGRADSMTPAVYFPPPQWVRRGADAVRYGLQGLIIIIY